MFYTTASFNLQEIFAWLNINELPVLPKPLAVSEWCVNRNGVRVSCGIF